jgi:hypothetical protein
MLDGDTHVHQLENRAMNIRSTLYTPYASRPRVSPAAKMQRTCASQPTV